MRAGLFITPERAHIHKVLAGIIDLAKVSNLVLSLLTNAVATSIIAARSWCVRVIFKLELMLTCTLTHTCVLKEISQDFDKLQCCWPSYTGMQSIGFPGRVWSDLYLDGGKSYQFMSTTETSISLLSSSSWPPPSSASALRRSKTYWRPWACNSRCVVLPNDRPRNIVDSAMSTLQGIYPIVVLLVVDLTNSFRSKSYLPHCSIIILPDNEDQASHLDLLNFAAGMGSHRTSVTRSNTC